MLKSQFDSIELHGVDDQSYLTVSLVAQCLMKYKYVTMERLKTKTVQAMDAPKAGGKDASNDADPRVVLQPRLVVHLKKTSEFNSIFDEFEAVFNKEIEAVKDEIDATVNPNGQMTSDVDEEPVKA